jgi:glycosyltransferase involved in cell wall biosynthesis
MRIAVITTSYPTYEGDPAGHFVHAEVIALGNAGHAVDVIHPTAGGAFGWPGVPARLRESPVRALDAAWWTARAAVELDRLRPDRIVAHWCLPSAFPIAVATARRPELEVVSHGSDVRLLGALPRRARTSIVRAVLRRAARWRFVSAELRESLEAVLPSEEARAVRAVSEIVPGALVVPDVRDDARAKRNALEGRRLYVCAGRLVASKRVDKVIDYVATSPAGGALAERAERVLVVLGDGPERLHLERVARAWQMDVRFLGKTTRREALGWIGAADELVHASRVEGLSTVVREAQHLGVPVTLLS